MLLAVIGVFRALRETQRHYLHDSPTAQESTRVVHLNQNNLRVHHDIIAQTEQSVLLHLCRKVARANLPCRYHSLTSHTLRQLEHQSHRETQAMRDLAWRMNRHQ